ncbi:hypothetical protein LUZ60_009013 [Juncus effusus]|nr:hypothetical protein LUZ60_009013 [Juncus effusus]
METININSALNRIERAHQLYREGSHEDALELYSEALNLAKSKAQKIALHSNRAACYLKMHDFKKAAEECTAVLELDHEHTGALMLRAQTLVTLRNYQSALFDVNRLIEINPNSEVYHNLHARLKTQLALAPIPESLEEEEREEENNKETLPPVKKTNLPLTKPQIPIPIPIPIPSTPQPPPINTNKKTDLPLPNPDLTPNSNPNKKTDLPLTKSLSNSNPGDKKGDWEGIPKPKGHSGLDYSRWDKVLEASSDEETGEDEDEEEEEEEEVKYRFRVRTVGVRPVK